MKHLCHFCGNEFAERWLVCGPGVNICAGCVDLATEVLRLKDERVQRAERVKRFALTLREKDPCVV